MASSQCVKCGASGAAARRGGLCFTCWQAVRPPVIDGDTIRLRREALGIRVEDAAAAVGLDPKHWVDEIEDVLEIDAEYAATITLALAELYAKRQDPAPVKPAPAPSGALAVDRIERS